MEAKEVGLAEKIAGALTGVLGVPVWLFQNGHAVGRKWRKRHAGLIPPKGLDHHSLSPNGMLWVRLDIAGESGPVTVAAGPFAPGSAWVHGTFSSTSAGDRFTTDVEGRPITVALLQTTFEVLLVEDMLEAVNDLTLENIRRIGATCADALGLGTAVTSPDSFHRVPPLRRFVEQLADPYREGPGLREPLSRITATLASGFHLVDLAGRSLVRPTKYETICQDLFRKEPVQASACVLSDLTHLWRALLQARQDDRHEPCSACYECPVGLTEVFSPLFCQGLAAGAVFTGQLACSEKCRRLIRQSVTASSDLALAEADCENLLPALVDTQTVEACATACQGLAGLMTASFNEWCRAENAAELRRGLIKASLGATLQDVAKGACETVKRHVGVSECSVWQLRNERLYMAAATAKHFYVRQANTEKLRRVLTESLIGNDEAFYELGEGLTGRTAQRTEPLFLANARLPAEGWVGKLSEVDAGRDVQFLGVPLWRDDRAWGVLRASKYADTTSIGRSDIELLKDIADELATLLQAKGLSLEAQHHAETFKFAMRAGAHEFRQPLQNINSQTTVLVHGVERVREGIERLGELLRAEPVDQVQAEEVLAEISAAGAELPTVCTNIEGQALRAKRQMENSLLFDTDVACNFQEEPLGLLFRVAEEDFRHRGTARNVRLIVWDDAKHLPRIVMARDRVSQVITNLLENAFKYSFRGERIHVHGRKATGGVEFTVTDRGTGIPAKYYDAIFDPYHRKIVEDQTRFIDGSGMGLPIVKRILDLHGGIVSVSSTPFLDDPSRRAPEDGHDVTFTVFLPNVMPQ